MSGLMVCGTGSDSGKSTVVAGLCRLLSRQGVKVAPFKAQNMALNSAVTRGGHEIGRAQYAQAQAAGVEPEVAMNPVLLKPTGDRTSQVVVMGRPWMNLDAASYQAAKDELWPIVTEQLTELQARFDLVICEGAGSPAEINLLDHDITNLRLAREAGLPAILVGDIDRGGVFASLFGTVTILPSRLAELVKAFVINKFRGDAELLVPGIEELTRRTGVPTIGVLPWIDGIEMDTEDSLGLERALGGAELEGGLDVAVIRFPRISNFTDLEALAVEPRVRVRLVDRPGDLGRPDLVILPGTKATVRDLEWLRRTGLADAVTSGQWNLLGICGGFQMMGRRIVDKGVEHDEAVDVEGLGLLEIDTFFQKEKTTRRTEVRFMGEPVEGYEIRHGRSEPEEPWHTNLDGTVVGTSVHGLFESDRFRRTFLTHIGGPAWEPGPEVSFAARREDRFDRVADLIATHVDMTFLQDLLGTA